MSATRLLLVCLIVAVGSASSQELAGVRWTDPAQLQEAVDAGLELRFVGEGSALLTAAEATSARARDLGLDVVVTDRLAAGQAWFITSSAHVHGRGPHGHVAVYRDPSGWALLRLDGEGAIAALDESQFLYPLPESHSLAGLQRRPAPRAIAARPLAAAVAVQDLAGQVSEARVRGYVRSLALLDTAGASTLDNLRTRYCLRSDTYESTEYIRDQLAEALGPDAVSIQAFDLEMGDISARVRDLTEDDELRLYNVVGELAGADTAAGYYLLCAHYDAIGTRTPAGWNWRTDPAPGADDNASGVAVVLEAARVLSQAQLPWNVRFALWSGEELGLHGSRAYARRAAADDDRILGVINIDMVGYNWDHNRVELVTNPASRWLVDLLIEANERYDVGLQIDVLEDAYAVLSDHANFWSRGYDAILGIENYLPSDTLSAGVVEGLYEPYTAYHSTADVPDSVNWELVTRLARLSVAALGQYGEWTGLPNLAVFTGDVAGDAGDDLRLSVANLGGVAVEEPVRLRLSECGADSSGCRVVYDSQNVLPLAPGAVATVTVPWQRYGDTVLRLEVDPDNQIAEADEGDNLTYQSLHLLPHDAIVAYPNPFDAGRTHHLSFSGVPLFSRVEISTATGEPVWRGREEEQGSLSREILWSGRNRAGFPVAGGVYVYTVTSFEGEVLQRDKIAVIR